MIEGMDFDRGELVRLRMEPAIVGQVIGEKDWGSSFLVRLGGSTEAYWFENIELETYQPDGRDAGFGSDEEPPKTMRRGAKSTVVHVDFSNTKKATHVAAGGAN